MENQIVYIGGVKFDVHFEYIPEIKASWGVYGGEAFEDETVNITKIFFEDVELKGLLLKEAPDLYDKIAARTLSNYKEGEE